MESEINLFFSSYLELLIRVSVVGSLWTGNRRRDEIARILLRKKVRLLSTGSVLLRKIHVYDPY